VASLVIWFGLDNWVIDQINREATRTLMQETPNRPKLPQFLHFAPFFHVFVMVIVIICLQCFDAVGWAAGRASGL